MPRHEDIDRAPIVFRWGLPFGGAVVLLTLAVGAAFGGTSDWSLAIPIGLVGGGLALGVIWIALRRRGISVTGWLDDYWSGED